MPAGCSCGPNSPLARALGCHCVHHCTTVLQSLPVSCHFRGCKAPLFRIVSGAISSELALPLPFIYVGLKWFFSISISSYFCSYTTWRNKNYIWRILVFLFWRFISQYENILRLLTLILTNFHHYIQFIKEL